MSESGEEKPRDTTPITEMPVLESELQLAQLALLAQGHDPKLHPGIFKNGLSDS